METGGCNLGVPVIINWDIGHPPYSRSCLIVLQRFNGGGEVINTHQDGKHTTTQMGSGHFPKEGFGKASFFKFLKVNDGTKALKDPKDTGIIITQPNCYDILNSGSSFYHGGPGRNPKCP